MVPPALVAVRRTELGCLSRCQPRGTPLPEVGVPVLMTVGRGNRVLEPMSLNAEGPCGAAIVCLGRKPGKG